MSVHLFVGAPRCQFIFSGKNDELTPDFFSPRKRADFPQVFRHERTLANRLRETNHGSTAPPPERCPRQEPLGRNGPPAFTLCHRAGGPSRAPFATPSEWIQGREVEMTVQCQNRANCAGVYRCQIRTYDEMMRGSNGAIDG